MNWRTAEVVPSSLPVPEELDDLVRPGGKALDVGCGEASLGGVISGRGGVYFGVDVNMASLRRALTRGAVAAGDAAALPFRDGAFDLVLFRAVLTVIARDPGMTAAPRGVMANSSPAFPAGAPPDLFTGPSSVLREALRVCRGSLLVQDFLQTTKHPLYAARYAEGEALGAPRGVFPVREGGTVLYWARHYVRVELEAMIGLAGGRIASWREFPAPTRSGNVIRGVVLTAVAI
jgi:SAM-dependent methyltransferase